jgi:RNA polymerase sigma-70 factor, ECF subfamily
MMQPMTETTEHDELAEALRAGNEGVFTQLASRHRAELKAHCYRMLGSLADAEDLAQETLLKAWRGRSGFEGRASVRTWLYKIATNACLDFLESRKERRSGDNVTSAEASLGPQPHVPWLQPFPDRLLEPDARLVSREALELGYLVALQCLPPKQRAALICCDVLEWSAKETAELLSLSVASVNSSLQRAREALQNEQQTGVRVRHSATPEQEQRLLQAYVKATEEVDVPALAALLREDVRCTMPPMEFRFTSRDEAVAGWVEGGYGSESYRDFRCILTRTNGLPAVACYRRPPGSSVYTPMALDVLKLEGEQVVEITTFELAPFVRDLDLPATL